MTSPKSQQIEALKRIYKLFYLGSIARFETFKDNATALAHHGWVTLRTVDDDSGALLLVTEKGKDALLEHYMSQ